MKCIFIYNPKSGKGKVTKKLALIESTLKQKFSRVTIYATKSAEDTIRIAKDSCDKYDAIIFAGGDGTFNDIASGVSGCDIRPILGYIPTGTVNDIARNLRISRNIKKALKVITDGNYMYHDVGTINDSYFIYVSAIGTFTEVSYRTKQKAKKTFGRLAYVFDGLKEIVAPKTLNVHIETENESIEMKVPLVLITNTRSVGGIPFNRTGHLNDGEFDIILVKKGKHTKGLINIAKLFTFGIGRKKVARHFISLRGSKIRVKVNDDITWCVDGEVGPKGEVLIKNLHNHLRIYVPKKTIKTNIK